MAVAFFDLDRTLIDCNSGRLWMQSEWKRGRIGLRTVAWGTYWLSKYHLGYSGGLEEAYRQGVQSIKGLREDEIEEQTHVWFHQEIAHRLRRGASAVLDTHRQRGDRIVLATSASIYEALCAAKTWDIELGVATSFKVANGRFTGEIDEWGYGPHKWTAAQRWAEREGETLDDAYFYTDSKTDLPLLERVGHPIAVHPDRKLRQIATMRGWPIQVWNH